MQGEIGHYFGTEIDEKWWRRYAKNGMLARGKGRYWYDEDNFYFLRRLTETPIAIRLGAIRDFKFGTWHAGQWGGGHPVLKLVWVDEGMLLSSGFAVSRDKGEAEALVAKLRRAQSG